MNITKINSEIPRVHTFSALWQIAEWLKCWTYNHKVECYGLE